MNAPEESTEDQLVDGQAGSLLRPYAVTRGRTRPNRGRFDLISLVKATWGTPSMESGLGPEHLAIVRLCQGVLSVAEVAAYMDLPAGTVRVLLGDLLEQRLVEIREPSAATELPDESVYEAVINGLRAL